MRRADLTMHGSRHERRMWAIHEKMIRNDAKPNGFLSRNTKPAGNNRGPGDKPGRRR